MSAAFSAAVRIHSRTPAVSVFLLGISSYFLHPRPYFCAAFPQERAIKTASYYKFSKIRNFRSFSESPEYR